MSINASRRSIVYVLLPERVSAARWLNHPLPEFHSLLWSQLESRTFFMSSICSRRRLAVMISSRERELISMLVCRREKAPKNPTANTIVVMISSTIVKPLGEYNKLWVYTCYRVRKRDSVCTILTPVNETEICIPVPDSAAHILPLLRQILPDQSGGVNRSIRGDVSTVLKLIIGSN